MMNIRRNDDIIRCVERRYPALNRSAALGLHFVIGWGSSGALGRESTCRSRTGRFSSNTSSRCSWRWYFQCRSERQVKLGLAIAISAVISPSSSGLSLDRLLTVSRRSWTEFAISSDGWCSFPGPMAGMSSTGLMLRAFCGRCPRFIDILVDGSAVRRDWLSRQAITALARIRILRATRPWAERARVSSTVWYGPVNYQRGSEPHMTIAVSRKPAGGRVRGDCGRQSEADFGCGHRHQDRRDGRGVR